MTPEDITMHFAILRELTRLETIKATQSERIANALEAFLAFVQEEAA